MTDTESGETDDWTFADKLADADAGVAHIERIAGDDEAAHSGEDALRDGVLRWIAKHGDEQSAKLALVALRTSDIEFARWCA